MARLQCPEPAYQRILGVGLHNICKENAEIIAHMGLYKEGSEHLWELLETEMHDEDIAQRIKSAKDEIEADKYDFARPFEIQADHPIILAYTVLGDRLKSFEKWGFPSQTSLEKSINSFCIGEQWWIKGDIWHDYEWRTKGIKTRLSNANHGDLSFGQYDLTTPDDETDFATEKVVEYPNGFGGGQNGWTPLLPIVLHYAKHVGKHTIPEIKDWKTHAAKSNVWGTTDVDSITEDIGWDLKRGFILEKYLLNDQHEKEQLFFGILGITPYVQDNGLFFLKRNMESKFQIKSSYPRFQQDRYEVVAKLVPDDIGPCLRGIYHLFARSRQEVPFILDDFCKKNMH